MKVSLIAILLLTMFTFTSNAKMSDWKEELNKYHSWNTKKTLVKREIAEISKPVPVTNVTRIPAKEPAKITSKAQDHKSVDLTYKHRDKNEL